VPRAIPLTCTPLRRATRYPPALAIQTWGSGAIRGAAQGGSVYGGLRGRACSARGGSRCRKGVGGRVGNFFYFFILPVQCLTPPVRAFCVSRDRGGGGGGSSGPSTVSTRALVAAGSAASCGGVGGGPPPRALRLVLIPPGAPRGSQAPGAAWAGAGHAPRTLGGIGAC